MTRCLGRRRRDCYWLMYASCLFGAIWWLETTLISRIETGNASIPNKLPNADDTNSQRGSEKLKPDIKRGLRLRNATDSYRPEKPRVVQSTTPNQCTEKTNFVYIKEIKCASQTLVNVFRRFGLERNLSFVTPIGKKIYLGWPWLIQERYYRPSKTDKFNILCEHAIFDERLMRKLMPDDVVFIASLREPFAQFKSMFNYYAFQDRYCVPDGFHMSKNLMAYNLGFPTGYLPGQADKSSDEAFIADFLSDLDRTFHFVVIVEYFHESLILLRRLMCWKLTDLIYLRKNVASYSFKADMDPDLVAIYRKWSPVDYRLYDHFNRTFWKRVAETTPDFREEVEHFDRVTDDVNNFCRDVSAGKVANGSFLTLHDSKWNKSFRVDKGLCETLNAELLKRIQSEWDKAQPKMKQPVPDKEFC
ncbi:hypothetical protein LSH36_200g04083 [Paralvinella palmiformis]|uniref:Galactosylceramide sulfotransferase-like n=1 Tax=Paralvinella palmiformis TaxID=53620 RepID=A0AAD9N7K7_9ANNE|nr:hypothetical protein LSH36_200g04083 [Paralvinella palmiformis]